jgi:3-oxoacyl-[acyl-carrier protein] reductase
MGGQLLAGKVALVTGGSRGIGSAICRQLVEEGARVVSVASGVPRPHIEDDPRRSRLHLRCDVADEADVQRCIEQAVDEFGDIDVLVNNAGISRDGMIHRMELAAFRRVIEVNLQGAWLMTRSVLEVMRRGNGGSIVNLSSVAGDKGNLGQSSYAASKAGVEALTKVTAREGAAFGIRANAIRPGLIATEMTEAMPKHVWEEKLATIPLSRAGLPSEVASVALFLASDLSSYVTGATIDVSGGRGI